MIVPLYRSRPVLVRLRPGRKLIVAELSTATRTTDRCHGIIDKGAGAAAVNPVASSRGMGPRGRDRRHRCHRARRGWPQEIRSNGIRHPLSNALHWRAL